MKNINITIGKAVTTLFSTTLLSLGVFVGCTADFEEINRPGENLSYEELSRDNTYVGNFIIGLQNKAFPEQENEYQMCYDLIGNSLGRYFTYANNGFTDKAFARFIAPQGWSSWPFKELRPKVDASYRSIKMNTTPQDLMYQWATILWAQATLNFTDMYGPLPITLGENDKDTYNSQEEIYKALFEKLDKAIDFLSAFNAANVGKKFFTEEDHIYGGDFSKWQKFANSLKLRMAIRIRFVDPVLAQKYAEEAVADGVMTENSENLAITYEPNGLYKVSVEWGDTRACADIDAFMNGYNDPRITKYFKPTEDEGSRKIIGCLAGANIKNKPTAMKAYSAALVEANTRGVWMCAAEMYFCRAEGAMLNWQMGGTAEELYNKGIEISFEQWGAGSADSYIADDSSVQEDYTDAENGFGQGMPAVSNITIKWKEDDTEERKLERISTQKWIAMYPNGHEAWNEIRRTGYPKIFDIPTSKNGYTLLTPNRIPLPATQKVDNKEAYDHALQLLGGKDDYATKLWWQR